MNQWWQFWPGYFGPEDCERILQIGKTIEPQAAAIGHEVGEDIKDLEIRRAKIRWLPRTDSRLFPIFQAIEQLFHEANRIAFGFDLTVFREVQLSEYGEGDQGTYGWHQDTEWATPNLMRRKLSMSVQLSAPGDYEGGDLQFQENQCIDVPPADAIREQGTIIVFPSFLEHRVTPVTSGTRNSMVTWMEGPYFR